MTEGLGHARRRLVIKIIEQTWMVKDPSERKYTYRDILFIVQEMFSNSGLKYIEDQSKTPSNRGFGTFKSFVEHMFYRNLANYDSMVLLTSEKGTGKCLYINSNTDFVVSADGRLVHPDDAKEIVCMDENFKLTNCKVKKHYSRISKEVFELKLRSGKKICLTKEHPLRTLNDWKQLQNLVPGDFIATPRKYNLNNNKVMNEGLVKLLAYLIADGFMGGLKLEFTKNDEKIRQDFKEALHDYDPTLSWGNSVRIISTLPNTYNSRGFLPRNGLITYLQSIGLYEKRSGNKFIPQEILELNNELISLFINRLFSCDGCVELRELVNKRNKSNNKCFFGEITYTSKSELLIRQLQHVLLRFSIISKITSKFKRATNSVNHKGEYYWQLTISGKENIINFRNNINFFQEDKKAKLEKLYEHVLAIKSNTNVDVIPKEVFANYTFKCEQKEYAKYLNIKRFQTSVIKKNNMSISRLEELNVLENNDYFDTLVNSDIFWDRIESITKLDQKDVKVYDLEVNDANHNFVCNDIIVHNSSSAIMIGREWCLLLGIRFSPARHIAYSNKEVTEKIDALNKFEPIVCDEAIRFALAAEWAKKENKELKKKLAQVRTKHLLFVLCFPLKIHKIEKVYLECLDGNTIISTEEGKIKIKDLEGKTNFKVWSYNEDTKEIELRVAEKCVKTKIDYVWKVEFDNTTFIEATEDHLFLTNNGWKKLKHLDLNLDSILNKNKTYNKIISITKGTSREVYDILNVEHNCNYVANDLISHNSFVNYWCDLFGRGVGAIYVKDKNPVNDSWRLNDFKLVGSYTEFTSLDTIEKKLKQHPNFWRIIKFPKPPEWLYNKYLEVREKNVYDEEAVRNTVSIEDVHNALLVLSLQDVMTNDTTINLDRISLHMKNKYNIPISKKNIRDRIIDAKQLIDKIREEQM